MRRKYLNSFIFVILAFILSRFFYYFYLRVRFDTGSLDWYWQYIDPYLLKNNLLQSVYYLHSQPPLFNLFLGIVLKLFPDTYSMIFSLCYLVMGFLFTVSLFLVMKELNIPALLSMLLTVVFMISPSVILYENYLVYEYPVATLLCVSSLFLLRFLKNKNKRDGVVFFASLAAIALIRSVFHVLWFAAVVLILVSIWKKERRMIITACLVPFIVVSLFYVKNLCVFGTFSLGSAYTGQNIAKMTVLSLPMERKGPSFNETIRTGWPPPASFPRGIRESLLKNGQISGLSFIEIFSAISLYRPYVDIKKTGIPILDQEFKSTGAINAHNIGYLEVSRMYLKDALFVMKSYPFFCLKSFWGNYTAKYFLPGTNTWPFNELYPNYEKMRSFDRIYSLLFYGQSHYFGMAFFLLAGIPFLFCYGIYLTLKSLSKKHGDFILASLLIFMLATIINVTFISVFTWENPRFRFIIDPFYLVILGLFLSRILKRRDIR